MKDGSEACKRKTIGCGKKKERKKGKKDEQAKTGNVKKKDANKR